MEGDLKRIKRMADGFIDRIQREVGERGVERGVAAGCDAERRSRASMAGKRESVVLLRGGRVADHGHTQYRGVHGVCVHQRVAGAVVCDEGAGRAG